MFEGMLGLILLGLVAGVISGCLGVGSGLILVPALFLLFAFPQKSAQGISLSVMVPMALVGAIRYVMMPEIKVDLKVAAIIAIGAVVGSLIGSLLAVHLPARILRRMFAVFLVIVAVRILWPKGKTTKIAGGSPTVSAPAVTDTPQASPSAQENAGPGAGRQAPQTRTKP